MSSVDKEAKRLTTRGKREVESTPRPGVVSASQPSTKGKAYTPPKPETLKRRARNKKRKALAAQGLTGIDLDKAAGEKRLKKARGKPGYVYVAELGFDNLYKIGMTARPNKRLKALQEANPKLRFVMCYRVHGPKKVEYDLHWRYWEQREARELFWLGSGDLKHIREYLREHQVTYPGEVPDGPLRLKSGTRVESACPECDTKMVLRQNRKKKCWFLGCGDYPRCHYATDIPDELWKELLA